MSPTPVSPLPTSRRSAPAGRAWAIAGQESQHRQSETSRSSSTVLHPPFAHVCATRENTYLDAFWAMIDRAGTDGLRGSFRSPAVQSAACSPDWCRRSGRVTGCEDDGHGGRILRIAEPGMAPHLTLGESVAVNGACLTVVERDGDGVRLPGRAGDAGRDEPRPARRGRPREPGAGPAGRRPLGGHFVTGHVDCVGTVAERVPSGDWLTVWFEFPAGFGELLVAKGSVAVDGVSLTVVDVRAGRFSVMLIPHTLANTTLGRKPVGAAVNLEFDLLAKHVRSCSSPKPPRVIAWPPTKKSRSSRRGHRAGAAAEHARSAWPSPRQTLSYLRGLFEAHGLEAKSKLGQNFLIDLNLLDLIVRTAELDAHRRGAGGRHRHRVADGAAGRPGRGGRHGRDRPRRFQPVARQVVGERPNVRVRVRRLPGEEERTQPRHARRVGRGVRHGTAARGGSWSPTCPTSSRRRSSATCSSRHRHRADGGDGAVGDRRADAGGRRARRTTTR